MKTTSVFLQFAGCINESRKAADAENWEIAKQAMFAATLVTTEMICPSIGTNLGCMLRLMNGKTGYLCLPHLYYLDDFMQEIVLILNAEAPECEN